MSAGERTAVLEPPGQETAPAAAPPAERHERTAFTRRRGWLVRRALLTADLTGLLTAFAIAEVVLPGRANDRVGPWVEVGLFVLALPFFVLLAKLQGLY